MIVVSLVLNPAVCQQPYEHLKCPQLINVVQDDTSDVDTEFDETDWSSLLFN